MSKEINESYFDVDGYDKYGKHKSLFQYDDRGFAVKSYNTGHIHKNGTEYDDEGYDYYGFDENGYDKEGYDIDGFNVDKIHRNGTEYDDLGFNKEGYKKDGYDIRGYNKEGYNKEGFDRHGFDREGFNRAGLNSKGLTREQVEEGIKQRRANYLGLKNKAEKLGKGEMSLDDYVKCSKTPIVDLIEFAKDEHMEADVIRGLYKYIKQYSAYKKPFSKKQYLDTTTLIIDGNSVKPTEDDVDKCVAYLKANDVLICDKIVRDTVRKFLRGEIDITLKTEELQEQVEENKSIIAENEEEIKDTLVELVLAQQSKIKSQEAEKTDLKSQRRDIDG